VATVRGAEVTALAATFTDSLIRYRKEAEWWLSTLYSDGTIARVVHWA
jgi:uncharacterized membrane protein